MRKLLVTGGAGFIGSNFIRYMLDKYEDYEIINLDKLTYAGNKITISDLDHRRNYSFVYGDICDVSLVNEIMSGVDMVVNFAAESHVDNSISDPGIFVKTNVLGTQVLLEAARKHKVQRFLQISTDEVYGSLGPTGFFTEETPLASNSPYSSSKASADLLVRAYHHTYGMNTVITRCSNNYGPYQFPEKLIPLFIKKALNDEKLPVYGNGLNIRDWLHVEDHCSAIDLVLHRGRSGEVYNIGGNNERTNIQITKKILEYLGKPESLITYVEDRPGHDLRYAIDSSKIQTELGWRPKYNFDDGIQATIDWYIQHQDWVQNVTHKRSELS
ncbi:dTDP-glucose 4,6-dehydratase [Paenibacillus thermoaerophilus]|uniref:dTDP-glucose 4,6-dehydratase n=1 Tax=Paenibacillus thermoaerophilus TaxID=1215385 RepID=A0ABW2UZ35_9BACL|nr:dTDP-glucose 4,6-dehydratase [Paenibacillus thermoaerophilus]